MVTTAIIKKYCKDILDGNIPSGVNMINAVSRFMRDLKNCDKNGWYYSEEEVEKAVKFFYRIKHTVGKHAGEHFVLQPWQLFVIANIYGFFNKADNTRRFQTAYIEVARKNGKTALVAGMALYHLLKEGEAGPEVLLAANSKDQAKIAFSIIREFTKSLDSKREKMKVLRSDIVLTKGSGMIKVLASDDTKLDGYNCSLGIVDEYHAAANSRVRDVIRSSMGMRMNPLLFTITTAGFDKSLPCYALRTSAIEIAAGIKKDESFFAAVFSMDDEDDWKDPANWIKSNPNIDVTVGSKFIENQVSQAINNPNDEVSVKTKNLNIWCDSSTTWIPDEYIVRASEKLNIIDFKNKHCFCGVDLSSNTDLTASAFLFTEGEGEDTEYYFFFKTYIPRETLSKRGNLHADIDLYKNWASTKYLTVTSGNVTDYDYVTKDILDINSLCPIEIIYYDKYNATSWAIQCTDAGMNMHPYSQTIGNFNAITKAFERLMLGGKIHLEDSPIVRYCLRNVEIKRDHNGNVKPSKISEFKKIDLVIAALQALAGYMESIGLDCNLY